MFPRTELRPFQWQDYTDEPIFDPKIHLSNWNIDEIKQESSKLPNDSTKFGFTKPFKVLTAEGYSVIRTILNREYLNGFVKPDRRIQYCLRGVTYRSPFLRAFSESCELSKLASEVVDEPLIIHPILSNHSHVNWGLPTDQTGEVKNVDQWHQDSVSHVLIVLMSDMTDSVGGELEIIFKPTAEAFKMLADTNNNIPNEHIVKVKFPGPGYGVIVTGSELVHHVTPLLKSNSPRITLIQSFASADPWVAIDRTKWDYYSKAVSAEYAGYEWMNYQAWKLGAQLSSLPQRIAWSPDNALMATELRRIAKDLEYAADQIERKVEEEKIFVEENQSNVKR